MPELKRTFSKGRMNKDLDERLVPLGEYRDAKNIEIATSEGSDVGTVQNIKGNTEKTTVSTTSSEQAFGLSHGSTATCVAAIADEKNNKIYSLIADGNWFVAEDSLADADHISIFSDYILEYNVSDDTYKYVFNDIYEVRTTQQGNIAAGSQLELKSNQGVRAGMIAEFTDSAGTEYSIKVKHTFGAATGNSTFDAEKVFLEEAFAAQVDDNTTITFKSEKRVLNFDRNVKITGVNILDDLLMWTDNVNEPKRISISRSIAGTGGSAHLPSPLTTNNNGSNRTYHTRLYAELDSFSDIECVARKATTGVTSLVPDTPIWVELEHVTAIKQAPTTPPTLEMTNVGFDRTNTVTGNTNKVHTTQAVAFLDTIAEEDLIAGAERTLTFVDNLDWREGDVILATTEAPSNPKFIENPRIRFKVSGFGSSGAVTNPNVLQKTFDLIVLSVDSDVPMTTDNFYFALDIPKPLFELEFPRFAYRYKYTDGEYSPFSPFSEIAFMPGPYSYYPTKGYNLGMTNQLRGLKIKDYLVDINRRPLDVVAIDILYKEETSPNIYTVKTITRQDGKAEGLELVWPDIFQSAFELKRGELEIKSELIHAAIPENQLIRPYDNLPRKALAQEITGNRIVYGNYVQGYDVRDADGEIKPEFDVSFTSNALTNTTDFEVFLDRAKFRVDSFTIKPGGILFEPRKSVKSLRTYQVGVVYCDEFGRETPVLTDKKSGSIYLEKDFSAFENSIQVSIKTPPPSWSTHYKYYLKETSNEYYNLAIDRAYNADDGNAWISFPSSERNKVDEETYLILKKAHGSNKAIKSKARYKILAIENEAPDFIKTNQMSLGSVSSTSYTTSPVGYPVEEQNFIFIDYQTLNGTFGINNSTGNTLLIDYINKNNLFLRFIKDNDLRSDYYKIAQLVVIDDGSTDTSGWYYSIKLDKKLGDDIGFVGTASTSIAHEVEFKKEEVENRPEFDGKFFVKLERDPDLEENVLEPALSSSNTKNDVVIHSREIHYASGFIDFTTQSADAIGNAPAATGNPPDEYLYFDGAEDPEENATGDGKYVATPYTPEQSHGNANNTDGEDGTTNYENAFEDSYKGKWAIDNENAAFGGAGRGIHKDAQGRNKISNKFELSGGTYYKSKYNWDTINDCCRVRSTVSPDGSGSFENNDKLSQAGRDSDGALSNAGVMPNDVYLEGGEGYAMDAAHNVMHLSKFGISHGGGGWAAGRAYEDSGGNIGIIGNPNEKDDEEFTKAISTVGTLFRWADDPDQTVYRVIRCEEQVGIRNYEADPKGTKDKKRYYKSSNRRVRYTIKFEVLDDPGVGHSFGTTGTYGFNPVVNAVNKDDGKSAVVGVNGIVKQTFEGQAGANDRPYNYLGLHHRMGNSLTLQIIERFTSTDLDDQTSTTEPAVFETEPKENIDLDIYYEASPSYPMQLTKETAEMLVPLGSTFTLEPIEYASGAKVGDDDVVHTITEWTGDQTFTISPALSAALSDGKIITVNTLYGGSIELVLNGGGSTITGTSITVHGGPSGLHQQHNQPTSLPYSNCIAFGNGVESDRIRDDFNAPQMQNGVKASSVLAERYREERRKNGLIYSGIYNSTSGVNNLNQFIAGEKITKDLNPEYGSIQKLHTRNTNLLTLCEDKILNVLANKDALFNADGNPQLISSTNVLGQATPIPGEYGISTNPESFAHYADDAYFTDATRGKVMQIRGNALAPISEVGMSDYFADLLKDATLWKCLGTYDEKKNNYNLTVEKRVDGVAYGTASYDTITWSKKSSGWTRFKSYYPEQGISINNNYYTWKNGSMWQHHTNSAYNTFYGSHAAADESHVTMLFNDAPSSVKSFMTLNYEGSQAKVVENDETLEGEYYNIDAKAGWYCESIDTNKQEGQVFEFIEKEGKWFNNIYGVATTLSNLDVSEQSVEGIGTASAESYSGTGNYTLTFQDNTSEPYENVDMQGIFPLTTVAASGGSALNSQYPSGVDVFGIIPNVGFEIIPTDVTVGTSNGHTVDASGTAVSVTVADDTPSSGIRQITFGGNGLKSIVDKIQLRQYEVAPSTAVIIKFFFKAVTISADQTITLDFD